MKETGLFDYQAEMVTRIGQAFESHRSVMVQMPTGTGKTVVLAEVVSSFLSQGAVWIVAHRRELVAQIKETVGRFFPQLDTAGLKVLSVQWLSRHYREMETAPSLLVVDEAHHAVARTYAEVMRAFPKARKLGLTATPCRLDGSGFTDLFDVLLTSWCMERFMARGRLSVYDYYSIKPDSEDQRLVDSLQKRGADGDYQLKELNEVMDVRPSLERLCQSVKQYVWGKKGIVYAFSIAHAEHIAEYYREQGIEAVAVSSQTTLEVRKAEIERFKRGEMEVLVSVDLFSEGFDCPDVEFVQLARPTLSLSKYLQMVGRGLRVAGGKSYCVILDNVGLYRRFGLPSADRDWQCMFEGRTELTDRLQAACERINRHCGCLRDVTGADGEMMMILRHDSRRQTAGEDCDGGVVEDATGWTDRKSGLWFAKRPQTVTLSGVEFCTDDGRRFYPRIRSKFVDEKAYVNLKTLELQAGRGIKWKRMYVAADDPDRVYLLKDKLGSVRLYADEAGNCYAQGNPDMALTPVHTQDEMDAYCREYSRREKADLQRHEESYAHGHFYPVRNRTACLRDGVRKGTDGIWTVKEDVYGESYWVDGITGMKHYARPVPQVRGFVKLLKVEDWYYIRNIPDWADVPLRNWQIVADENICVVNNEFLFVRQETRRKFRIRRRTDDFSYFVVKEHEGSSMPANPSDIIITQYGQGELKMECNGVPYVPCRQGVKRS